MCLNSQMWGGTHFCQIETSHLMVIMRVVPISPQPLVLLEPVFIYLWEQRPTGTPPIIPDYFRIVWLTGKSCLYLRCYLIIWYMCMLRANLHNQGDMCTVSRLPLCACTHARWEHLRSALSANSHTSQVSSDPCRPPASVPCPRPAPHPMPNGQKSVPTASISSRLLSRHWPSLRRPAPAQPRQSSPLHLPTRWPRPPVAPGPLCVIASSPKTAPTPGADSDCLRTVRRWSDGLTSCPNHSGYLGLVLPLRSRLCSGLFCF